MDDTRARFLSAIADRLGEDRIVELHLFSPIRQGVLETGVAVVAVEAREEEPAPDGAGEEVDSPYAPEPEPESSEPSAAPVPPAPPVTADRLVVFTARYRLTRKGPDRGKWFFEVAATADAPLATVDLVARGVTLRSKDATDTERLGGDQLRVLLRDPAWRTPN